MPEKLNFNFPISLLVQETDLILNAATKYTAQIGARLPENHVATTRTLATQVSQLDAQQKSDRGDLGGLTAEQDAKLAALQEKLNGARATAKQAFKGQDVKLREEFQVGINKPGDLASVVQRARIVLAGMQKAGHTAPLQAKGWLAADTTALEAAIDALDAADETQEGAKGKPVASTGDRNAKANALYDALVTVQNAANLQWPESGAANGVIRGEFRLGKFPPRSGGGRKPEPAPTTPTPTPTNK